MRLLLVITLALLAPAACSRVDPDALPNVRLGMAPRDVRDRFEPGGAGAWQTSVGSGDDAVLEWTAREPAAKVDHARFEFHLGMLVAVRATLRDPSGPAELVQATPKTVSVRRPAASGSSGGTDLTVLARDCPTHKDEAETLASRAK